MPTYEFICTDCNTNFEKWLSMNEDHKINCPNCGSNNTKKVFSAGAGILFKGSGFYCTDYKNKGEKEESCCTTSSSCGCSKEKSNSN